MTGRCSASFNSFMLKKFFNPSIIEQMTAVCTQHIPECQFTRSKKLVREALESAKCSDGASRQGPAIGLSANSCVDIGPVRVGFIFNSRINAKHFETQSLFTRTPFGDMTTSKLRQLVQIISSQVDAIESHYEKLGTSFPDLDAAVNVPPSVAELGALSPEVIGASTAAVAACGQLMANLKLPAITLFDTALGVSCYFLCKIGVNSSYRIRTPIKFQIPACLRAASLLNVVEILRDAGPQVQCFSNEDIHVSFIYLSPGDSHRRSS